MKKARIRYEEDRQSHSQVRNDETEEARNYRNDERRERYVKEHEDPHQERLNYQRVYYHYYRNQKKIFVKFVENI